MLSATTDTSYCCADCLEVLDAFHVAAVVALEPGWVSVRVLLCAGPGCGHAVIDIPSLFFSLFLVAAVLFLAFRLSHFVLSVTSVFLVPIVER